MQLCRQKASVTLGRPTQNPLIKTGTPSSFPFSFSFFFLPLDEGHPHLRISSSRLGSRQRIPRIDLLEDLRMGLQYRVLSAGVLWTY